MGDKLVNIAEFGTVVADFAGGISELGFELDDMRGRQDTQVTTRLFPTSAGGGGQTAQNYIVNRYRPGNRYKFVRLNGTVVQFNAVINDIAFGTEEQRAENVVNVTAVNTPVDGVVEFGNGGPLTTDPALTSHAAGVFGFMTTRGKAICNVEAGTVAGDRLVSTAVAGQLDTFTVAADAPSIERVFGAASGLGVRALVAEPATGFKANLTWVKLT